LPFYVLLNLVPAWLRTEGIGLKEIGFFTLVQLPYVWKFLWAPLLDRYSLPVLGRRRGWMLLTQLAVLASIAALGIWRPGDQLQTIVVVATLVAIFSATLDIALDAYRRELLPDRELGLGNSVHVQVYRISQLVPGSLGMILFDHFSWSVVFVVMAAFVLVGIGLTILAPEATARPNAPTRLSTAIIDPFREYWRRRGASYACAVLAFMVLYKVGDNMATALATPFYLDLGFSGTEIGIVAKNAGLWSSIAGGILGGIAMLKIGINRALWIFGVAQLVPILGFAVLAEVGHSLLVLGVVVGLEAFGVGLGTAAFVAFIARETVPAFAATQIALFTALAAVPRTFANAITGFLIEGGDPAALGGVSGGVMGVLMMLGLPQEGLGYTKFFVLCAIVAIPGMLLLFRVAPWRTRDAHP